MLPPLLLLQLNACRNDDDDDDAKDDDVMPAPASDWPVDRSPAQIII